MKNPKQKLKNILLLVTVFFAISCSKDVYDEINNPNEKITIKKLDERQIKSNKKLSLKLSALNETKTAVIGRFVHDTIYNFVINTNHATHIISNSQETFTFEVLRVNPTPGIENLVLISQPNGTFNATLVKYSFDSNQLFSMDQTAVNRSNVLYTPIDFDYNTVLNSLNSRCTYTINCEETWTESCGIPPSEGTLTGGSIETTCEWVMTTGTCYGSCGENSNSYPEFITLPTTNTSGGTGTITSQLTPSQIQFFTGLNFNGKDTFNSLSQEVINSIYAYVNTNNAAIQINAVQQFLNNTNGMWLGEQSTQTQQSIFNYLITNGFSTTSRNKINQLINVAIATNTTFTIDPTINSTNGQVFNSISSLQNYLNNQSSVGSDFEYDIQQQNQKIASTKFWIGAPYNGIKVNIKQNMNPYSVINVTSEMFGVTLFADWNQSDFSSSILNNVVTVDVYGVSSIKIFFEGIGTIYHENQHFQIKINKLTGVIISANVIP
jgi:hypothetical protein